MKKIITQIPLPGGSGLIPTGAMQFQDDWPGLFIRGDNCMALLSAIRNLQRQLAGHPDRTVGALLSQLNVYADIIENNVMGRGD
jgi:hypothetical protein